jgi:hypothetical protein
MKEAKVKFVLVEKLWKYSLLTDILELTNKWETFLMNSY